MAAARAKMIARRFGGKDVSKTGGKGSMRRKKKTVHKTAQSDDKRIGATLKKLGVSDIPGIEEVNVFKRDGSVVHFKHNVKLQASTGANTYVITGKHDEKSIQELMPGILPHLGPELAQQLQRTMTTEKRRFEESLSVLKKRLAWYAENQDMIDKNDELVKNQQNQITTLKKRLVQLEEVARVVARVVAVAALAHQLLRLRSPATAIRAVMAQGTPGSQLRAMCLYKSIL